MSEWYLRKGSGEVYGPKALDELMRWAADGRIAPDDELSQDQQAWQAAPTLTELGLLYTIQLEGDSTYGPIHIMSLCDLLAEGDIQGTTPIQHVHTGEIKGASERLIPYLVQQHADDVKVIAELKSKLESMERRLESAEQAALQLIVSEPVDVRDIPKEVLKWQRLHQSEKDHRLEVEDRLQKQIIELKSDLQNIYSEKDRYLYRASQAERKLKRLQQAHEENPESSGKSAAHDGDPSLREAYQRLTENYDDVLEQLKEKSDELTKLRSSRPGQISSSADLRVKELEVQLEFERTSRDDALARLADLEQTHMKLLKSFRDMNDQFIRLRDQPK